MLSRKIFADALFALSLFTLPAAGQIARIEQDFVQWTQIAVDGNPPEGSGGFAVPGSTARNSFRTVVQTFLNENWAGADTLADSLGYDVVAFRDTANNNATYYGLIPQPDNADGRGFYFVRPRAGVVRRLVVEAPHAVEDDRTGVLAAEVFRAVGARAVLISGVDRCANAAGSTCTGSTDCGAHKVSDMAHAVATFFQVFHEEASAEHTNTVVLQLHGFLPNPLDPTEPEFSISDGTGTDNLDPGYRPNLIYREIQEGMEAAMAPTLPARNGNSCNMAGHGNFKCGTENVQARYTNGSPNACSTNATAASGRFIHLEMSPKLRDGVKAGDPYTPQILIDALLHLRTIGRIGDRIYADANQDGNEDVGEPGIHGAVIEILDTNGTVVGSTTSVLGYYKVGNLPEGYYRIRVQLPPGYAYGSYLGPDGISPQFYLRDAQDRYGMDLDMIPPAFAQIGDFVWADDGDGVQNGESGFPASVGVQLLTPEGDVAASTTTNALNGLYNLSVLPGSYSLRVVPPAGQGVTRQVGGSPNSDSDIDPATGKSAAFSLASGALDSSRDAGLVPCFNVALIAKNASWKWKTGTSSWPSDWTEETFDDSAGAGWQEGVSPLGFGDDVDFITPIPNPEDTGVFTTYFRLSFDVADPTLFQQPLALTFSRDDGVILYLNGVEVARRNLPWGAIVGAGTPASTEAETAETISIPASLLASGTNVLAVELHQVFDPQETEPTGLFDLSLTGKVCSPCQVKQKDLTQVDSTHISAETEDKKDDNFGTATKLVVDGSPAVSALLKWNDVDDQIPANATVLSASLFLFLDGNSSSTNDPYAVHALKRSWSEGTATWLTPWAVPGAKDSTDSDSVRLGMMPMDNVPNISVEVPLNHAGREVVQGWVDGSLANFGFLIDAELGSDNGLDIGSDENSTVAKRPKLRVVYIDPACTQ
jgi:hypothetical protein